MKLGVFIKQVCNTRCVSNARRGESDEKWGRAEYESLGRIG